jgi:hypothetical protein
MEAQGPQAWQDTLMFYTHRSLGMGLDSGLIWNNWAYIDTEPIPTPSIRRVPIRSGIGLGINIVVPDPENEPLVYHRLTQFEGWRERGVIMEVWQDDFGYFYTYRGRKHYLPERP